MVMASALIEELTRMAGYSPGLVTTSYGGAPSDFPVHFVKRLPFGADRFGMVGITLRGEVWLLDRLRQRSPLTLLTLLRHEAEHVAQQRQSKVLFYPRYVGEWLINLMRGPTEVESTPDGNQAGRSYRAYRNISYEREAYGAGDAFARELHRGKA